MTVTDERAAQLAAAERGMSPSYWAARQPDRLALITADGDRTFAEINANSNRCVRALRARGIVAGNGVALMCSNRPEFAEVLAASQRAGLRLTTVNWHLTGPEVGYIVDNCDAEVFVADARFAGAAEQAAALAPNLRARIAVGGDIPGFERWDDALAPEPATDVDDPVLGMTMLYTSGTTGRPKGVFRRGTAPTAIALANLSGYHPDHSVHLCTGPWYHAAPLAFSLSTPAIAGVTIVVMDSWDPEHALALIERHRVTHTHMVPTMFHRLLSLPDDVRARYDTSSLQVVIHGAAPCPAHVKQRMIEWWGPVVWEYYAATEGTGTLVGSAEWLTKPGTVGKPNPLDQVKVFDEDGAEVAPGTVGTVFLKAPDKIEEGRFEYYKSPEKTAGSYRGDYFTLGDVGYLDADGFLFLTDRSAHLIISGGVNIYPAEVEAAIIEHPAVGDVGVIGVSDDDWGEVVVAVVEPQAGVAPSSALGNELIEWCRDRIAHYKCPRRVDFVEALPRHDNGKLYKQVLREQYRDKGELE
ncbi:MAG: AMP-dependent synthetase and ligase [Actinomycetia bacterium]|nr:AMP-dependent synthetase and ligase [Actinomycetes bacterium]